MVKRSGVFPDRRLLLRPERDLAGGQYEVKKKGGADERASYLGHVCGLKEVGKGVHGAGPQVDAGHENHVAPHKRDKPHACQHLNPVKQS